jgi:hypothetical protein
MSPECPSDLGDVKSRSLAECGMARGMNASNSALRVRLGDTHLATDSQDCSAILREIVTLVLTHGGQIHPGACWHERGGQLTVTCDASMGVGEHPLVVVPRELLVPVSGAEWADSQERLMLLSPPSGLTPVQKTLLDLHIQLYNATGKIPWIVTHHPRALLVRQPELLDALQVIRPDSYAEADTLAHIFLDTRVFGLKPDQPLAPDDAHPPMGTAAAFAHPTAGSSGSVRKTHVLMPLIDILNHHPQGAPYRLDALSLQVQISQPRRDQECFAAYGGRRDVLDLALHYGYLDEATPFAFSAPVEVEVEGLCRIRVAAGRLRPAHPLDPPRTQWDGETLELSHLCAHSGHPERLQTVLRLPLLAIAKKRGYPPKVSGRLIEEGLERLCQANVNALGQVETAARDCSNEPAAGLLIDAVQRQATILRRVLRPNS